MKKETADIRILIADHRSILRNGVRHILETQPDFKVVADTDNGSEFIRLVPRLKPDIVLLGTVLAKVSTFEALRKLSKIQVKTRCILMVDTINNNDIIEGLKIGVWGVVLNSAKTPLLFKAIRSVQDDVYWLSRDIMSALIGNLRFLSALVGEKTELGDHNLSNRQLLIIKAIMDGYSNKDMAKDLGISERTVKYHLTKIYGKVGVSNRMALARYSLNHRLIRDE